MATNCIGIEEHDGGLDFKFGEHRQGWAFCEFLKGVVPVMFKEGKELISEDKKSSTINFKTTYAALIAPVNKDDLVCLPHKLNIELGKPGPFMVVYKINSSIHLINPFTLTKVELSSDLYWRN